MLFNVILVGIALIIWVASLTIAYKIDIKHKRRMRRLAKAEKRDKLKNSQNSKKKVGNKNSI